MDMLQVRNGQIVSESGATVRLRGTCVGGWMNMENFINGYPGSEHGIRAVMAQILGPAKAEFFFDRLLDAFFSDDDAAFLAGCGATVVRLPINYRHFERDSEPFVYRERGFERLTRALDACARHGLYAILDLHAVQGWQNPDWHSDNANRHVCFWQHRQFQDRFVSLWKEIARRYKGNPAVAGYNVMNEPVTNAPDGRMGNTPYQPDWDAMNRVYHRVVTEIRSVDPRHIIFLEGDYYSVRFERLDPPFADNLVYSSHMYNVAGFGPGAYPGTIQGERWDPDRQREIVRNHEGTTYARTHNVPLWVGEFGAVYNGPESEKPYRLRAMDDQLGVYEEERIHWTTWTYKDVGIMGWVELDPESEYRKMVEPILKAKRTLDTDLWMGWMPVTRARELVQELAKLAEETIGSDAMDSRANARMLGQAALDGYFGALLQPAYARLFRGMSETRLDEVLQSFAFKKCKPNQALVDVLKRHMGRPA